MVELLPPPLDVLEVLRVSVGLTKLVQHGQFVDGLEVPIQVEGFRQSLLALHVFLENN